MALKPDRNILETDISLVCNDVHSKGAVLVYGTAASGVGIETPGVASLVSNPSGYKVAGLSLANFVDIDQTRYHRNFHKDEQVIGEKAPLLRKGYVVTDMIVASPGTINAGANAYLSTDGKLTATVSATGGEVATPKVGTFASKKDENGYAKVYIELPN
jgi:hypothetical protein